MKKLTPQFKQALLARHVKIILGLMDDLGITYPEMIEQDQKWFDLYQKLGGIWTEYGELCQHPRYEKKKVIDETHDFCVVCGSKKT